MVIYTKCYLKYVHFVDCVFTEARKDREVKGHANNKPHMHLDLLEHVRANPAAHAQCSAQDILGIWGSFIIDRHCAASHYIPKKERTPALST